jgi:hypothetical protein
MLLSINQLSELTGQDRRTIVKRLEDLQSQFAARAIHGDSRSLLFNFKMLTTARAVEANIHESNIESQSAVCRKACRNH